MPSLQDDLDRIASLQGKVVQPGNYIAGFGDSDPPPPGMPPGFGGYDYIQPPDQAQEPEQYDDPQEPEVPAGPPSPLIPHVAKQPPIASGNIEPEWPLMTMAVMAAKDGPCIAHYGERHVQLTEQEMEAVANIVKRAQVRHLREQMREVEAGLPRRVRLSKPKKRKTK